MKNQLNFFKKSMKADEEKYLINHKALTDPQSLQYFYIFGQLFANAITNATTDITEELFLGFDFAEPVWKYLLDINYTKEDFKHLWDQDTLNNYMAYWNSSKEEVEYDLGIELSLNINNQIIEYSDYQSYVWALAEKEFTHRPKKLLDVFRQGFNNIFHIKLLNKYFNPYEITILTSGDQKITPEKIEKSINYTGGNSLVQDFFKRYINESTKQMLEKFLKFTTGSSKLPFESKRWKIFVRFIKSANIKNCPIAHTCSKELEIPMYKSYDMLKKMCDIAFTAGLEGGYGFA